jgi:site-specific DNA-methyltransferase (adenine-specific)
MPKSRYEPWGIFRKPVEGTVAANLRKWKTGGLARVDAARPFGDVLLCGRASPEERKLATHPALKPQRLMRHLVQSVLPLGEGTVLDPFAGSGSTLAAAEALGVRAIGLERNHEYALEAADAIPRLASFTIAAGPKNTNVRRLRRSRTIGT